MNNKLNAHTTYTIKLNVITTVSLMKAVDDPQNSTFQLQAIHTSIKCNEI